MKKLKLTLLLFMMMGMTGAWAQTFTVDGISYIALNDYQVGVYHKSYTGDVVIPETVEYDGNKLSVTMIYDGAFSGCTGLTSVSIPSSVTNIGQTAFSGCTGITSITIPSTVTSIGSNAFYNTGIYKNSPDGVFYVGNWVCGYKGTMPADAAISIDDGTIGIASSAFSWENSLSSVTLPNTVSIIDYQAFYNCSNLTSINIPNSVTSIGRDAFYGTYFYNNSADGVYYVDNMACGYKGTMPSDASITLLEGTRGIGNGAFNYKTNLKSITMPNSVTTIGNSAFSNCTGLTDITMSNSVTTIGSSAFSGCTGLTTIDIPSSVTSIEASTFYGCSSLASITIPNFVTTIGVSAFNGCKSLTEVAIPNSVTTIGVSAFNGCESLTEVAIPNSVTTIGANAFYGCKSLTEVAIPNSVTTIGESAFDGCNSLTEVAIPNSVEVIEEATFRGCVNMESVTIPNSVTTISNEAFEWCRSLTDVTIPNSVTTIGKYAFSDCALPSVTIPSSVTSIGDWAFSDCYNLTSVTAMMENPVSIGSRTFTERAYATLYVPYGCKAAYESTNYWKEFKKIVELPKRVVLNETDITLPEAATGVDVLVKRTIKAGEWSTLCLPFAMTEGQVKEAFGNGVQLLDFDDYEVLDGGNSINVKFNTISSIGANHPCVIKVTEPVSEFNVDGVDVAPEEQPMINKGNSSNPRAIIGNYVAGTLIGNGCLFLSDNEFWYSVGKTKIKALRAYFNFDDLLPEFNEYLESRMHLVVNGTTDGISNVSARTEADACYDLQGRKVTDGQQRKGIYVKQGKKVIVK